MTRRRGRCVPALTLLAVLAASGTSQAQELRKDSMFDGVLIGAGTGAAAGVVLSLATEDVCSPVACAYLGGVAGGLVGLLIDTTLETSRPVAPGSFVDDGLWNGAGIGALTGAAGMLVEAAFRCRPGPDRPPCTREGVLLEMRAGAQWMAIVGLLVDAAIPTRVKGPAGSDPKRSQRRLAVRFNLRF